MGGAKVTLAEQVSAVVERLPLEMREEVHDFARFLLKTKASPKRKRLGMSWAGGLKEFRDQ